MAKVPFHFVFLLFSLLSFSFSVCLCLACLFSVAVWAQAEEKKIRLPWQEKRIAVSSFAVLECEIPINWADELVCIGFLFFTSRFRFFFFLSFSFLSHSFSFGQHKRSQSIHIHFASHFSSLGLASFIYRWVCLFARYIFHIKIETWTMVCWVFDADVVPLKLNT